MEILPEKKNSRFQEFLSNLDSVNEVKVETDPYTGKFSCRKFLQFLGPGFLVCIAYVDPGNFDTDITAGSSYSTKLLWVMLLATLMAVVLQFLATKLGLVARCDLAQSCRRVYSPKLSFILWIMAEIAVVASDIPEVLGTAYALNVLLRIPIWLGVIITAFDTLFFLFIKYFNIRFLEVLIGLFLTVISICFIIEMVLSKPNFDNIITGFIPFYGTKKLESPGTVSGYVSSGLGLIGAVVMPHNLFLHSSLVQTRKVKNKRGDIKEASIYNFIECSIALVVSFLINTAIIAVSASTFYPSEVGLFQASNLLDQTLGSASKYVFALAILASGQSSTITGTYAGQFIMEGFLQLKISIWKRNLITRGIAILPSLIFALWTSETVIDSVIKWSQIILSIQLPFALIPLVHLTNHSRIMKSFKNTFFTEMLGWGITVIIIGANITLLIFTIGPLILSLNEIFRYPLLLFVGFLGIGYIVFMVYLIIYPIKTTDFEENDLSLIEEREELSL